MQQQHNPSPKPQKPKPNTPNPPTKQQHPNKTLMRLEQPIYQLKKKQQSEQEYIIRKLMNRKQDKPQIGAIQRSPLFGQLEMLMPTFKKANQELKSKIIGEEERIDVKLEKVQDSSSDSEQDKELEEPVDREQMVDELQQGKQSTHTNQIQFNLLRYELTQNLPSVQVQPTPNNTTAQDTQQQKIVQELLTKNQHKNKNKNKKLIEQI